MCNSFRGGIAAAPEIKTNKTLPAAKGAKQRAGSAASGQSREALKVEREKGKVKKKAQGKVKR